MFPEIERTLVTREQIAARVVEMAGEIARDLRADLIRDGHSALDEDRVVLVPIMTGAMIFAADLIREMPVKLSIGLVTVSSYPGQSVASKGAKLASALPDNLAGKHVLVIDDILDSGQTLALVRQVIGQQKPASLRIAVLLDKKTRRVVEVPVDYVGFEIPDEFVVGYGLDYDGYYRNHPEIAVLNTSVLDASERRG
ncbi:MAG: hypoxanthine phosphoribosyltransferase [Planctomycetota bacterium]|nr:MAG: hypoxanthine phosphoribosyltransferase [Planctomycetota bacterium]